jgi:hydroxypyruvate isomerase
LFSRRSRLERALAMDVPDADDRRRLAPPPLDLLARSAGEPINNRDMPGLYLNRTDEALRLIERVRSHNLYLQAGIYHMEVMEGDLARRLEAAAPRIAHIRIADNPGRREPGTGKINYAFLIPLIDRLGYDGSAANAVARRPRRPGLAG